MPKKGTKIDRVYDGDDTRIRYRDKKVIFTGEPFTEMYQDADSTKPKKRTCRILVVSQASNLTIQNVKFALELQYKDHTKWFSLYGVDWAAITGPRMRAIAMVFRDDNLAALLAEAELL